MHFTVSILFFQAHLIKKLLTESVTKKICRTCQKSCKDPRATQGESQEQGFGEDSASRGVSHSRKLCSEASGCFFGPESTSAKGRTTGLDQSQCCSTWAQSTRHTQAHTHTLCQQYASQVNQLRMKDIRYPDSDIQKTFIY